MFKLTEEKYNSYECDFNVLQKDLISKCIRKIQIELEEYLKSNKLFGGKCVYKKYDFVLLNSHSSTCYGLRICFKTNTIFLYIESSSRTYSREYFIMNNLPEDNKREDSKFEIYDIESKYRLGLVLLENWVKIKPIIFAELSRIKTFKQLTDEFIKDEE